MANGKIQMVCDCLIGELQMKNHLPFAICRLTFEFAFEVFPRVLA
jgi:hypothetical protein